MDTDKYISLDNLDYFAGKFKDLIEDTTVPSVKLEPSSNRQYIQRSDIKDLGEGSFICYIDADNKYRVGSTDYIYGPAIFFTNYFVEDLGEGNQDHYDFLVLCTEGIKKYKTNTSDPASFTYSWTNYVTEDDMPTDLYEINTTDTINPYLLTGIHKLGLVTKPDGVSMSWTDYTSSDSESMTLPYGTFVIGSSTDYVASGVSAGGLQMLTPDGKRYTITNITAVAATVTEVSAAYMKQLAIATYNTSTFTEVINMVENNKLVYCKVSTGGGGYRYAVVAFKDRSKVEFNYVRKTNDGNNELFVYTVNNNNTWTTVSMPISRRIVAGTNMTSSYNASTNTLTLNATGGSSLDVAEIDTAGTYTLDTFTAHTKTIVTADEVYLSYQDYSFYSFTGTYSTITKKLPIGTEITYNSYQYNLYLYIEPKVEWNYIIYLNQATNPKGLMAPDVDQIVYDKTVSNYLISNSKVSTKSKVLRLINETQFSAISSGSAADTTTRPFFKMIDSNLDVLNIHFEFTFTTGSDAVALKAYVTGAYPSSNTSGSYDYGINYYYIKKYVATTCYIKLSDLITRSVTKVYTTSALTTEQNYWSITDLTAGYMLQDSTSILGKNNTTAWTPTGDYNPATKKYVDDAVAAVGGGGYQYIKSTSSSTDKGTSTTKRLSLNNCKPGTIYSYKNYSSASSLYYQYSHGTSSSSMTTTTGSITGTYGINSYANYYGFEINMFYDLDDVATVNALPQYALLGVIAFKYNYNEFSDTPLLTVKLYKSTSSTTDCTISSTAGWAIITTSDMQTIKSNAQAGANAGLDASQALSQCSALDTRVTALEQGSGGGGGSETLVAAGSVDGSGMTHISWVPSASYNGYILSVSLNVGTSEFSSLSIAVADPNHTATGTIPSSGKFIIKLKDSVNDNVLTTIDVGQLTIDAPSQMFTITDYVPAASCNIEMYETSGGGSLKTIDMSSILASSSTPGNYELSASLIDALNMQDGDTVLVQAKTRMIIAGIGMSTISIAPGLWTLSAMEDPYSPSSLAYELKQLSGADSGSMAPQYYTIKFSINVGMLSSVTGYMIQYTSI